MTTVKSMVIKYLKEHGYDGLCNDECGCGIDDLAPCQCIGEDCEAAKKIGDMFYPVVKVEEVRQ